MEPAELYMQKGRPMERRNFGSVSVSIPSSASTSPATLSSGTLGVPRRGPMEGSPMEGSHGGVRWRGLMEGSHVDMDDSPVPRTGLEVSSFRPA